MQGETELSSWWYQQEAVLLRDKKGGILSGNLEEAANDYQTSTSAVRVLERTERWGCTQLSRWHL